MKKKGIVREISLKMRKPRSPDSQRNRDPKQSSETQDAPAEAKRLDEDQWQKDIATLRLAAEEVARRRPIPQTIERRTNLDTFHRLAAMLNDSSLTDRGQTLRKLYQLDPERAATFLNVTLQESTPEDRQQIGTALETSGLVEEAIRSLISNSHSRSYRAFSLLFLVAKTGTVRPLLRVIEEHPNIELRLALIRLLTSSRAPDLVFQFQRLLAKNCLPNELCVAMKEAVAQMEKPALNKATSAA
jgi:hypothetical protein